MAHDFEEIAHTGGKVIFTTSTDDQGQRSYSVTVRHSAPRPAGVFAVYSLPQGIAVETIRMAGLGQPWNAPPSPDCVPVFLATDSEGMFGHACPRCAGYWRSMSLPQVCPYCGLRARAHNFLTAAQKMYVLRYCERFQEALAVEEDGEHVIDMDVVADAVDKEGKKPDFYYSGERQQTKFKCEACGSVSDILGRYSYCAGCGTRNDLQQFEADLTRLRDRINAGGPYNDCVRDAVALFDSAAGQYARQLVRRVPMTPRRRARLEKGRFHDIGTVAADLKSWFDIDILENFKPEDAAFVALMFYRRHVYEHGGGEADQKYLADSGDKSVRLKQALRETQESSHRLIGLVAKMATNLHQGFHALFPPIPEPVATHAKYKASLKQRSP